jgi:(2Fe-2S) ferredoxin
LSPRSLPDTTCSAICRRLDEPLLATASRVRAWVLVEQPGPWGSDALVHSRLDPDVGRALHRRARASGARVLLIRRPGRTPPGQRQVFLAHTGRRSRWLERLSLDDPADLLGLDWSRLDLGEPPGYGATLAGSLYLVCTNGRHDQCCATWGRPLAQALVGVAGDRLWESSHIGGDRFAGNLVCLPEGVYYGRVGPADAARTVALHERGQVDLDHYRGRCFYPPVVQAAEHFLRRERSLTSLDGLVAEHRADEGDGVVAVRFAAGSGGPGSGATAPAGGGPIRPAGRWLVRLLVAAADPPRPLTCHATRPFRPPAYRLLSLEDL